MRTAVIPAAGMGTRFLPATLATPKELLPIYDTPALQFGIDEAIQAGIERIVVVTSRDKPSIEAYIAAASTPKVEVVVVYQDSPRGLGHAIWCARDAVDGEPFAVLLPDEIMGDASLLTALVKLYEKTSKSSIGLKKVAMSEVVHYGNVSVAALSKMKKGSIILRVVAFHFVVLIFFSNINSAAQGLKKDEQAAHGDTVSVLQLLKEGSLLIDKKPDEALQHFVTAAERSKQLNFYKGIALSNVKMGRWYFGNNTDKTIEYCREALHYFEKDLSASTRRAKRPSRISCCAEN